MAKNENNNRGGKRPGAGRKSLGRDNGIYIKITKAMKLYHQDNRGWAINTLVESFNSLPEEVKNEYIKRSENL